MPQIPNPFRTTTFSKRRVLQKCLSFKTIWAITPAGLSHRRSEGTKEKPSQATMLIQRHTIAVDRSKDSEKQPCKTITAAEGCETKGRMPENAKEQSSRTTTTIWKHRTNGDRPKVEKQPSKIPPARANPGKSQSPKTMLLSSEWASGEGSQSSKTIQLQSMWDRVASKTFCPSSKPYTNLASKTMMVCSSFKGKAMEVCGWMDGYHPGPLHVRHMQGHLLHFHQKPLSIKPSHKCEVKIPKAQEAAMSLNIDTMLLKRTVEQGSGNKGFFTYPFVFWKKNGTSCFIMNLKPVC